MFDWDLFLEICKENNVPLSSEYKVPMVEENGAIRELVPADICMALLEKEPNTLKEVNVEMDTNKLIQQIAHYMIEEGRNNTSEGNWIFYFDEVADKFSLSEDWVCIHMTEIAEELYKSDAVAEVLIHSDRDNENFNFDIDFYTGFCPNVEDKDEPQASQIFFGDISWTIYDVMGIAEQHGIKMNEVQAEEWWKKNERAFKNLLIERGNEIIEEMGFDKNS